MRRCVRWCVRWRADDAGGRQRSAGSGGVVGGSRGRLGRRRAASGGGAAAGQPVSAVEPGLVGAAVVAAEDVTPSPASAIWARWIASLRRACATP